MIEAGVIPYPWIVEYIWFAKQLCYNSWHRLNRFIWESPIDISLQVARQKLESWRYLSPTQPAGLECFYRKLEGDDEEGGGNRWRLVMAMVTRSSTVVALGGARGWIQSSGITHGSASIVHCRTLPLVWFSEPDRNFLYVNTHFFVAPGRRVS